MGRFQPKPLTARHKLCPNCHNSFVPCLTRCPKLPHGQCTSKRRAPPGSKRLIGLAESSGEGLALVKEVYAQAHEHFAELAAPYSTVIDIDPSKRPDPKSVMGWSSTQDANALREDASFKEKRCDWRPWSILARKNHVNPGATGSLRARRLLNSRFASV